MTKLTCIKVVTELGAEYHDIYPEFPQSFQTNIILYLEKGQEYFTIIFQVHRTFSSYHLIRH